MLVICGEALFDVFESGSTPVGLSLDGRMGGSPFNVAIGLARLGQRAGFLGGVGRDFAGERLMRALRDEGVCTEFVARVDAPTTLMLVGVDGHGAPLYVFYGHGAADRQLREEHLEAAPAGARAYHFGSYSMVLEPAGTTQRILVERECRRSFISYDPNVRARVEPDMDRWRETLRWMLPRTHLLKVSEEDLGLLFPGRRIESCAADALAGGALLVVVTRGAAGAIGFTGKASVEIPAVSVAVMDTVGAGDTFQAALLTWLSERGKLDPSSVGSLGAEELRAALDFAGRAAAITCSRRGADMPRRGELGPA